MQIYTYTCTIQILRYKPAHRQGHTNVHIDNIVYIYCTDIHENLDVKFTHSRESKFAHKHIQYRYSDTILRTDTIIQIYTKARLFRYTIPIDETVQIYKKEKLTETEMTVQTYTDKIV